MNDHGSEQHLFAKALARHVEGGKLKAAFDATNRRPDIETYDRTQLSRWLDGTIPNRGQFVAALANRLGDLSIYEAWVEAQNGPSDADVRSVVTRFQGLTRAMKDDAFRQIRDDYLTTSLTVRSNFSMRVDLHDVDDDGTDYRFKARLSIDWVGHLAAESRIVFAIDDGGLGDAYYRPDCIFREVVGLDCEGFTRAFSSTEWQQQLSYISTETEDSQAITCEASNEDTGLYQFSNEGVDRANIKLRIEYPIPHKVPIFPILFKNYQIAGSARISLHLHSCTARDPNAFGFLGAGRRLITNRLGDEVVLEAGSPGVLLGADTGVIFYWTDDG